MPLISRVCSCLEGTGHVGSLFAAVVARRVDAYCHLRCSGGIKVKLGTVLIAAIATASATQLAHAGGQFVGDNGTVATSRAGAFVAKADDATALMHNPAGLGLATEMQVTVGANLISMNQEFQRAGVYENLGENYTGENYPTVANGSGTQPIPFIGAVIPRGRFTFGAGLVAPQGYGVRDYPHEVTLSDGTVAPAPQRYDAVSQKSTIAFPSIAIAYRATEKLHIGARFGWGFAELSSEKYVQGLSSPGEEPGRDSYTAVVARDRFIPTFGLGVHYKPKKTVEVGLNWTAPISVQAVGLSNTQLGADLMEPAPGITNKVVPVDPGDERCAPGGQEGALAACINFNLPMIATVGARYIATDDSGEELGDLELDVRWEDWSSASDIVAVVDGKNTALDAPLNDTVIRHGLQDVFSVRLGGSGRITRGKRNLIARAGVSYETAAAPATWSRLDIDSAQRFSAAGGLGADFGRFHVDVGIAAFTSPNREVRDVELADTRNMDDRVQPDVTVPSAGSTEQPYHPLNSGDYKTSYFVGSFAITAKW